MRKMVSLILFCSLLLVCFASCSNLKEETGESNSNQESEAYSVKLNQFFTKLQKDTDGFEKIQFFVEYQELHYELKESGKYDNDKWSSPTIRVTVNCNYEFAKDEDWYKACSSTDFKTLNTAFFNEYSSELSNGYFTPWAIAPALYFEYVHSETNLSDTIAVFYSDYEVLKQFVNLPYVKDISIGYYYSMPNNYFAE